jgi:hypothetical protein
VPPGSLPTRTRTDIVFLDALGYAPAQHPVGLAFDGVNYWSGSGGTSGGTREARYTTGGVNDGLFAPGLDFRSVFTDAAGTVYARAFADPTIYSQSPPGTFGALTTLVGGPLDSQSSVVLNGAGDEVSS